MSYRISVKNRIRSYFDLVWHHIRSLRDKRIKLLAFILYLRRNVFDKFSFRLRFQTVKKMKTKRTDKVKLG